MSEPHTILHVQRPSVFRFSHHVRSLFCFTFTSQGSHSTSALLLTRSRVLFVAARSSDDDKAKNTRTDFLFPTNSFVFTLIYPNKHIHLPLLFNQKSFPSVLAPDPFLMSLPTSAPYQITRVWAGFLSSCISSNIHPAQPYDQTQHSSPFATFPQVFQSNISRQEPP